MPRDHRSRPYPIATHISPVATTNTRVRLRIPRSPLFLQKPLNSPYLLPYEKPSNAVTLSAFVQTPTEPAPAIWVSLGSMYVLPSNATLIAGPENSTRSVCHVFFGTGASTYLMVLRLPPSV